MWRALVLFAVLSSRCHRHSQWEDGVSVRVSVTTNPPSVVTLVPQAGSKRLPLELGRTPIHALSGAFVGDELVMQNVELGLEYRERIEYGEPNGLRSFNHVFKMRPQKTAAERDSGR